MTTTMTRQHVLSTERARHRLAELTELAAPRVYGYVSRVVGLSVTVSGLTGRIGDLLTIGAGPQAVLAEVVAVDGQNCTCLPLGPLDGLGNGDRVAATGGPLRVGVGAGLRGRVLDGLGQPLDGRPLPAGLDRVSVELAPPAALSRRRVDEQLALGVRAIDTLIPAGRGQRVGIFAGSGVGKSTLLGMIARNTAADVNVVALIGERGREVREFVEADLGPEGLARAVVVVATSDPPALVRLRAAFVATRIAEWFRDQGNDVMLMMDSLTRFCMAQREIGLSAGEPPTIAGYPPSVFSLLPRLLERAGAAEVGSITGLYTVLVDGDDHNEPIADAARSILDGHVVLSGGWPTPATIRRSTCSHRSRRVATVGHHRPSSNAGTTAAQLMAAHADARDLIEIGAYVPAPTRARIGRWPCGRSWKPFCSRTWPSAAAPRRPGPRWPRCWLPRLRRLRRPQ